MEIKEVWISSKTHHNQFNEIYKNNSWFRRILGMYKIPINFPYMNISWSKIPIVYNSKCSIKISEKYLELKANNNFGFINNPKNINTKFNKTIKFVDISNIDRYKNPNPLTKAFNINWISLRFNNGDMEEEFLLCAGGKIMTTISKETNIVYNYIENRLNTGQNCK